MTNEELIAKIKAEVERRVDILATVSIKQAKDGDSEMSTYYHGKAVSLEELISFLSTLKESEKPMNLEEEIERCVIEPYYDLDGVAVKGATAYITVNDVADIARHFAEWGYLRAAEKYNEIEYNRQRAEESVPNDLEEAAKEHFKQEWNENYWAFEGDVINTFIAGAKWQENKDQETIKLAEDHAFLAGADWQKEQTEKRWLEDRDGCFWDGVEEGKKAMREQMLKEAVEAEILLTPYPTIWLDDCKDYDFKDGQKVRVIFIKEN